MAALSTAIPQLPQFLFVLFDRASINVRALFTWSTLVIDLDPPRVSVRPLSVMILSSEHAPLSANRKYDINCMTFGSRPPAELSWYMDGKRLDNYTNKVRAVQLIERYIIRVCHRARRMSRTLVKIT